MDLVSLPLKLRAGYDQGSVVIVSSQMESDVMLMMAKPEMTWMVNMFDDGNLLFAADVMELLELALEGESDNMCERVGIGIIRALA